MLLIPTLTPVELVAVLCAADADAGAGVGAGLHDLSGESTYPSLQSHLLTPGPVFVHCAKSPQGLTSAAQLSISRHLLPDGDEEYPVAQMHVRFPVRRVGVAVRPACCLQNDCTEEVFV